MKAVYKVMGDDLSRARAGSGSPGHIRKIARRGGRRFSKKNDTFKTHLKHHFLE